jgi:hypothetical protein
MASWQARQRDPLLDSTTQAALEKRGKELLGLGLLALALVVGLVLVSYTPDDPSWMSATDEAAQNALGRDRRLGRLYPDDRHRAGILGPGRDPRDLGPAASCTCRRERVLSRIVFAPIGIALAAVFASTHVPGGTGRIPSGWGAFRRHRARRRPRHAADVGRARPAPRGAGDGAGGGLDHGLCPGLHAGRTGRGGPLRPALARLRLCRSRAARRPGRCGTGARRRGRRRGRRTAPGRRWRKTRGCSNPCSTTTA